MATARLAAVSSYLLDLYAVSGTADAAAYSVFALDGARDLLGADKAWWGLQLPSAAGPRLLASFRSELPQAWEVAWEAVKRDDSLAYDVARTRNRTFSLSSSSLPATSGLVGLVETFDVRETLCVAADLPDQGALMFLSLYRGRRRQLYTRDDKAIMEQLIPHLRATWQQNLRERLRGRDEREDGATHKAFVTKDGVLVRGDDGCATAVSRRWPAWRGSSLPLLLREAVERAYMTPGSWIGRDAWRVRTAPAGLLTLVEWRERTGLDRLAPRERQVARLFADGATHRDVARLTGLTPSTVRHYLREVYAKLEVDNKARLANLLGGCGPKIKTVYHRQ